MSYDSARKSFRENKGFVNPPGKQLDRMLAWNLNNGLMSLSDAVSSDLSEIENKLARIEHLLQQLVQRK